MLSKKHRISKGIFPSATKGRRYFYALFSITHKDATSGPLFAVVVGKSVGKTAVLRNKVRRRFYESLHKYLTKIKNKGHYIFFVKKGAEKVTFKEIDSEIKNALTKIGAV